MDDSLRQIVVTISGPVWSGLVRFAPTAPHLFPSFVPRSFVKRKIRSYEASLAKN